MHEINILAVILAGVIGFFPGALWYSPAMFLKPWAAELGLDMTRPQRPKHMVRQIGGGLIASIVSAMVFAFIVGPAPSLLGAVHAALAVAIGLIGMAFVIQYLFEGRSLRFWAINAGYHLVQFLIFALVFALWP